MPLHRLWGGAYRDSIDLAAYLFVNDAGARSARRRAPFASAAIARSSSRSASTRNRISRSTRAVRDAIGPDVPLRLDVNGAWTPGTARRQLAKLRELDPMYVEQPLEHDDLAGHAALRAAQPVPIALDESAYTLNDVGNIVRMQAADVILVDPHEAGGLWACLKCAAVAEAVGIPVTLHSGGELGLSQAAYLHLAASIPNLTLVDRHRARLPVGRHRDGALRATRRQPAGADRPRAGRDDRPDKLARYRVDEIAGAYLDPRRPGWFPTKPAY